MKKESYFSEKHPVVIMIYAIMVLTITMISFNPFFLMVSLLSSMGVCICLNGIKTFLSNLWLQLPVFIFTVCIQPLFSRTGSTILYYINDNPVTKEAYIYGCVVGIMLVSVIQWISCIRSMLDFDKITFLTGGLFPKLSLTISMILRFIPLFRSRYHQIHEAMQSMGMYQEKKKINAFRQFMRELSILISWSLENSIEISTSMEARGYSLKNKKRFKQYTLKKEDMMLSAFLLVGFIFVLYVVISGSAAIFYLPKINYTGRLEVNIFAAVVFCVCSVLPILSEIKGAVKWHYLNAKM